MALDTVAILGCGRTARAMCAYLAQHQVHTVLWGRDPQKTEALKTEGLHVTGCCAGHYTPVVASSLEEAVSAAKCIFVMTTAGGHLPIARQLHGLLQKDQRILIFNGNWGAYEFCAELGAELKEKSVIVAETGAMIFLADYLDDALHIKKIKECISVASVPAGHVDTLLQELAPVFPQFVPEQNIICSSINNSNPVIHTPISLFNLTRLENGEDYLFYGQAASRSVIRYIEAIDAERCRVAEAAGATPQTCLSIINSFWPQKYDNLYDAIKCNAAYQSGKGPATLAHRYIEEDIPFGMAPVAALGKKYGVATPYIDAMLQCYNGLLGDITGDSPDFSRVDLKELC